MNSKINKYIKITMALIVISAFYLLIGCPIKLITGISCLGCGMTRAWISVLRLDFSSAFYYHPLWLIPLIFIFVYFFLRNKNRKLYNLLIYTFILLFIIVYLIRLFGDSQIVNVEITKGLIYKIYSLIVK